VAGDPYPTRCPHPHRPLPLPIPLPTTRSSAWLFPAASNWLRGPLTSSVAMANTPHEDVGSLEPTGVKIALCPQSCRPQCVCLGVSRDPLFQVFC
jgi:hypothetical protein